MFNLDRLTSQKINCNKALRYNCFVYQNHVIREIVAKYYASYVEQILGLMCIFLCFSNLPKNGHKTGDFSKGVWFCFSICKFVDPF